MSSLDVHGAWTRRSATIDGGAAFETQFVVWLQAGSCYADLRVPLHPDAGERCFAGRSGWDGEGFRWTHQLDLEPGSPGDDDIGSLAWEADALIERGLFPTPGGPVAYEEEWIPLRATAPAPTWLCCRKATPSSGSDAMPSGSPIAGRREPASPRPIGVATAGTGEWMPSSAIGRDLQGPDELTGDILEPGWLVVEEGVCQGPALGVHR